MLELTTTGGTPPLHWSARGLAAGLSIDPNSGAIHGTPSAPGSFPLTVTVTDRYGSQTTQTYTLTITPTPKIAGARQTHSRWRVGTKLATITKTHRPPIGTTYFFTLNETAKVTFTFKLRLNGRKVKGHCIPQTRRYRHKPGCKRTVTKGTLSFTGHTGQNKLAFRWRITRTKKLPPGRYTLQITATLAGKTSPPATLTFIIT